MQDDSRQRIIHREIRADRRTQLVISDMNRLTTWERIRLWWRRFVSGGNDEDVFLKFRLSQARERVKVREELYADFENRFVLPALPQAVRQLCREAAAVRTFFETLWQDTDSLRRVLDFLLARRVPESKRQLNHFCSTHEMQEIFRTTESRNQLKQLVLDRVSAYVDRIPPSVMEEIETGLKPLYLMRDLALFNFDDFYVQFQSSERAARSTGEVEFKAAAAHRVLEQLELLYLALYNVSQISDQPTVYSEVLNFYLAREEGQSLDDTQLDLPDTAQTAALRSAILNLIGTAKSIRQRVPFVDIIRYFHGDPYYRFLAYVPRIRLADFYYSNLKIEVLQELDRRFNDLRMGVIGKMLQEVFPQGLVQFEYFHPEIQSAIKRAGIGQLQVYRSLQVIHTFVLTVYRGGLLEFMRIIGRLLPTRARQQGVDLTLVIAGLDDVAERLRAYDLSFSPDSDEGKTFYRYRYTTVDRDRSQISAYQALIQQKERDANGMIEKFQEQIAGVLQHFRGIKKSSHANVNERYHTYESTLADPRPFDARLDSYIRTLETTIKIINQMVTIDRET